MAHYKRKKSRLHASAGSSNDIERELKRSWETYHWYSNTPSSWNLIFHTRPRRCIERALTRRVLRGEEDLLWPLDKKPHMYYW